MRELELLAPARTADIGIAAIDCGADAVYIAGPEFGARQAAGNPVEDIRRLCIHAHRFGARIFAALNTIIYDSEYGKACDMLLSLQDAGVDAVIVQDLGLSGLARSLASVAADIRVPLHASTQCSIRTPERAAFLESRESVLKAVYGDANVTSDGAGGIAVKHNGAFTEERAYIFESLVTATLIKRTVIPRGSIQERDDVSENSEDLLSYTPTIKALPDADGNTSYVYYYDAAKAAAAAGTE